MKVDSRIYAYNVDHRFGYFRHSPKRAVKKSTDGRRRFGRDERTSKHNCSLTQLHHFPHRLLFLHVLHKYGSSQVFAGYTAQLPASSAGRQCVKYFGRQESGRFPFSRSDRLSHTAARISFVPPTLNRSSVTYWTHCPRSARLSPGPSTGNRARRDE